ncbi:hypothetical protein [Halobacillus sp. A5]|uniref:hypothetical protein n=1 Tax=Halobacillus sp. A5 TaxID=2880263 RepID=UPI0020A6A121|nr:hypothetical protein [Halobacillus sp. A5]MCP3027080.1 hypothetical protein [Halobacillus sp. A5]
MMFTVLSGCNFFNEQKVERKIHTYYQALIDEEFNKAFEQVYLFDYDPDEKNNFNDGTALSNEEAEGFYIKKIDRLKEQDYILKDYEISEAHYEDGHSFWHEVHLVVEQEGEQYEWSETIEVYEGKLLIGNSEDPLVNYRDGKMG